ncbi:cupin domain-containing protein [Kitasatospora sp. NPDC101183]|uniref:cupin domain-containing protein n=1 Tax=Kitasatospora sp. NPDC101183 TaxID=3364100 RepID=UPI0037F544BE
MTTPLSLDLFSSALLLHPDGQVLAAERRMAGGASGAGQAAWQVATFHVETDADVHADHWEMHPQAEEAVCCLSGAVRFYLRAEDPASSGEEMVRLTPGTAVVVPRGRWHRLELDAPSDLMSITLREGTRLEKRSTS